MRLRWVHARLILGILHIPVPAMSSPCAAAMARKMSPRQSERAGGEGQARSTREAALRVVHTPGQPGPGLSPGHRGVERSKQVTSYCACS